MPDRHNLGHNLTWALAAGALYLTSTGAGAASVFINEVHYDNAGADVNEFIEVAGSAGVDLAGWSIVLYNGSNGAPYGAFELSGVIPDQQHGLGALGFFAPGLQNGAPDGLALVTDGGETVELLSYEGAFTATAGPAAGIPSSDLLVSELGTEAPGFSLSRTGSGRIASDFLWAGPSPHSFGALNSDQLVSPAPVPLPSPALALASALTVVPLMRRVRRRRVRNKIPRIR